MEGGREKEEDLETEGMKEESEGGKERQKKEGKEVEREGGRGRAELTTYFD